MAKIDTNIIQRSINNILWLKRNKRPQHTPSPGVIEALAELADCELQRRNEGSTASADALLDTVGRLHARNISLQKGHATLTRRVQELEAELAAKKERGFTLMTPRGMETYSSKGVLQVVMGHVQGAKTEWRLKVAAENGEKAENVKEFCLSVPETLDMIDKQIMNSTHYAALSSADTQLQADIDALKTRVANLEFALHPESSRRQAVSVSETCRADAFRQAVADVVKQEIEKECRMGGSINRALR